MYHDAACSSARTGDTTEGVGLVRDNPERMKVGRRNDDFLTTKCSETRRDSAQLYLSHIYSYSHRERSRSSGYDVAKNTAGNEAKAKDRRRTTEQEESEGALVPHPRDLFDHSTAEIGQPVRKR